MMMKINTDTLLIPTRRFNIIIILYVLFLSISFWISYKYKLNSLKLSIFILLDLYFFYHILWNLFGKYKLSLSKDLLIVEKKLFIIFDKKIFPYKKIKNISIIKDINSGYHISLSGLRIQLKFNYMIQLQGKNIKFKFESGDKKLTDEIFRKIQNKI